MAFEAGLAAAFQYYNGQGGNAGFLGQVQLSPFPCRCHNVMLAPSECFPVFYVRQLHLRVQALSMPFECLQARAYAATRGNLGALDAVGDAGGAPCC
jgi:hypothetical protein